MPKDQVVPVTQETKAQKSERIKAAKNPWNAWDEVREFARLGRDSVPDEWLTYFRWWGIYTQGDGQGLAGGAHGEGKTSEYFMMRIGLPNGLLISKQLHAIGQLSKKYAHNLADITTRQNIQFHWLTLSSLVEVIDALAAAGLSTRSVCGDVVRNVTGCPLAGLDRHELLDSSPLAVQIAHHLQGNPEFCNLPRKFKISVSGCPIWCHYPEINDIALTAIKRAVNGQEEVGYALHVGGGLSMEPRIAERLPVFIRQNQALDVATASARIFRDQMELRENRTRARFKYLFMRLGWTAESFLTVLEEKLGYKLDPNPVPAAPPADIYRDHIGVTPQRQPGLNSVGTSILNGRLSGDQLIRLADLAEKYGNGHLRTTAGQNILMVNVPDHKTVPLVAELNTLGLNVETSCFWRGAVACTGTEFCKLAITETKGFHQWLVSEMEKRLPGFDQQVRLHISGCTNSCGQHWLADIGLEGKKIKKDGEKVDAYSFCVGGSVGGNAHTARSLGYRAVAEDVPAAIERLLKAYLAARTEGENLHSYLERTDDATLRAQLAGEAIKPTT